MAKKEEIQKEIYNCVECGAVLTENEVIFEKERSKPQDEWICKECINAYAQEYYENEKN